MISINPRRLWSQLSYYKWLKKWPSFIKETQRFLSGVFFFSAVIYEKPLYSVQRGSQHKPHVHPLMGTASARSKNRARWVCSSFSAASTLMSIFKPSPAKQPAWLEPQKTLSGFKSLWIWSKMTGRVPCNTLGMPIPPAICHLHTEGWIK